MLPKNPPAQLDNGLAPAFRELARRSAVPVEVSAPRERFDRGVEGAAYFAVTGDDTLAVLDTTTMRRTASIKLGVDPYVVAVSPDGRTGYVTNRESDTVTVLSLTS